MPLSYANLFCWYDLHTPDIAAAQAFYGALFGWTTVGDDPAQVGLSNGDKGFGGLEALPDGEAAFWLGYLGSDDVGAHMAKLRGLGATAVVEGLEIPEVGHIGVLADPSGAAFALYQPPADRAGAEWQPSTDRHGDFCWAELSTNDVDEAKAFYMGGFGWDVGGVLDTAPDGYNLMTHAGQLRFGIYERPPEMAACSWTFCVYVADVSATVKQVAALGGTVIADMEVPSPWFPFCSDSGMVHLALFTDPQGACVGLLGPSEA